MEKSVETYLQLLDESLEKKINVLNRILDIDKEQENSLKEESLDADTVEKLMNEKGELIKKLDQLDDGFDSVYQRIKEEIQNDSSKYANQVKKLQHDIRSITDLQTSVEALEKRLKDSVNRYASKAAADLKLRRATNNVARNYYEAVNKISQAGPQFMDKKK
ncbi:MAG: hypothetical protein K6E48_00855 [Lachnospiraceae bacterium]|nr:hypothetical protein [Lachnospiraceae bacterium]